MHIGLFFGSFNPIHIGHLAIANYLVEFAPIDRVWFVISPHNPLKDKKSLLADYHRLELVRLAINDFSKFEACDIEFKMPQPSYTIDTLARLTEKFPQHEFSLIMGTDGLETFNKWKNYQIIIQSFHRWVYPRPGNDLTNLPYFENATLVHAPQIDISSTFIRRSIAAGLDIRYFMHPAVSDYIDQMNFYH